MLIVTAAMVRTKNKANSDIHISTVLSVEDSAESCPMASAGDEVAKRVEVTLAVEVTVAVEFTVAIEVAVVVSVLVKVVVTVEVETSTWVLVTTDTVVTVDISCMGTKS